MTPTPSLLLVILTAPDYRRCRYHNQLLLLLSLSLSLSLLPWPLLLSWPLPLLLPLSLSLPLYHYHYYHYYYRHDQLCNHRFILYLFMISFPLSLFTVTPRFIKIQLSSAKLENLSLAKLTVNIPYFEFNSDRASVIVVSCVEWMSDTWKRTKNTCLKKMCYAFGCLWSCIIKIVATFLMIPVGFRGIDVRDLWKVTKCMVHSIHFHSCGAMTFQSLHISFVFIASTMVTISRFVDMLITCLANYTLCPSDE